MYILTYIISSRICLILEIIHCIRFYMRNKLKFPLLWFWRQLGIYFHSAKMCSDWPLHNGIRGGIHPSPYLTDFQNPYGKEELYMAGSFARNRDDEQLRGYTLNNVKINQN